VKARLVWHEKYPDVYGNTSEIKVWEVRSTPDRPHGYKYSLVYIVGGKRVIGYDNAEYRGDHKHYGDRTEPYRFEGLGKLVEDFYSDVQRYKEDTMRVKRVRFGIKSLKEGLQDFTKTCKAIERGEKVKRHVGVYFEDTEAFRKALTPKRLDLLRLIKKHHPKTLLQLSRLAGRDMKNVKQDVELLANLGMVSTRKEKTGRREVTPSVDYDAIELMIAV
jgi:predicted transcriptional regulator